MSKSELTLKIVAECGYLMLRLEAIGVWPTVNKALVQKEWADEGFCFKTRQEAIKQIRSIYALELCENNRHRGFCPFTYFYKLEFETEEIIHIVAIDLLQRYIDGEDIETLHFTLYKDE